MNDIDSSSGSVSAGSSTTNDDDFARERALAVLHPDIQALVAHGWSLKVVKVDNRAYEERKPRPQLCIVSPDWDDDANTGRFLALSAGRTQIWFSAWGPSDHYGEGCEEGATLHELFYRIADRNNQEPNPHGRPGISYAACVEDLKRMPAQYADILTAFQAMADGVKAMAEFRRRPR